MVKEKIPIKEIHLKCKCGNIVITKFGEEDVDQYIQTNRTGSAIWDCPKCKGKVIIPNKELYNLLKQKLVKTKW